MKQVQTVLIGLLVAVMHVGCASTPTGEEFSKLAEPRDGGALLYLYRVNEYYGKALSFKVIIDGQAKGDIGNAAYMIVPLEPGKHEVQIHGFGYKDEPRELDAPKGGIQFLRIATAKGFGGFSATLTLEAEEGSKAVTGLAGLKREPERFLDEKL